MTRSFTSFEQAAQEAGESRIYGGIHFEFSNQDGLAAGQNVGDWMLQAFNITRTRCRPKIVLNQTSGLVTNQDPTITGDVADNLSGVASLSRGARRRHGQTGRPQRRRHVLVAGRRWRSTAPPTGSTA